jgi:hypothetical protein
MMTEAQHTAAKYLFFTFEPSVTHIVAGRLIVVEPQLRTATIGLEDRLVSVPEQVRQWKV